MIKKIFAVSVIIIAIPFLSGCALSTALVPAKVSMANATFIKSEDGGGTWNPKIKVDDKKTIAGVDVLSMTINPIDSNIIYIGTMANGLFVSKDAGETWANIKFPSKVYNLIFDPNNANVMYGSGILNGRAKIFKRVGEDQEWKEIYTEPSDGTIISSLAINRADTNVLYAGTNRGVIIKTTNGGETWINLKITGEIDAPIVNIAFDQANYQHVFFAVFQIGILETKNGGNNIDNITKDIKVAGGGTSVFTIVSDPYRGGVIYVGTANGIIRRNADASWVSMNLIKSSKAFPIKAIAINPKNSNEIMYSSAKAIYKSTDSGVKWATFQLDTAKEIGILKYDQNDPAKIYAGLRTF